MSIYRCQVSGWIWSVRSFRKSQTKRQ